MSFRIPFAFYVAASLLGLAAVPVHAAAPEGYYAGIEGKTGGELKQALHAIIRRDHRYGMEVHTVVPYGSLMQPLREIWRDPSVPANILLAYSSPSVSAFASSWNREHLWPRSRGNTDQLGPDESDLFHVVPADSQVNSLRNNRYYDQSDLNDPGYVINVNAAPQISYDSNSWQPAPGERGDIARAMFYMDVRYNGSEPFTTDLELVSFPPSGPQMGNLNTLLLWHAEDPVDDAERARNNLIYSNYQGNRNPFIDSPELVAAIWGSGIPGDSLNQPMARISAVSATASESPSSPARFLVSLNQFAGVGSIIVNFSMSGTADLSEYTFSGGDVLSYDPATGAGTVRVQQGYSTALIDLVPTNDGVPEGAETAVVTLQTGEGYAITPDASRSATATLRDSPSLPVYWNFDNVSGTNPIAANQGVGFVSFSNWGGSVVSFSSGRTNACLGLQGAAGNNSWLDFNFSTIGYRNLTLGFWTRGTSTGFTNGTWSFSTDGSTFTTLSGVNTATTSSSWVYRSIDFSSFSSLNNAASVIMRYTLSGAPVTNTNGTVNTSGNNRLDELIFSATRMAIGNELREASVVASVPAGFESPATPAVFSLRLNGLAPSAGLTVFFQLTGTTTAADYTVTGAQTWDPATRSGTVFFPENEDAIFLGIQPVDDGVVEPAETVVLSLPVPSVETYLLGADTTATATLRDRKHNDNFADAYSLEGVPANAAGDNIGATRETGEPWHFSSTGSRSVWWRWVAPFTGTASINTTNSNFDTVMAVYTGTAVNALTRVASDNNSGGNLTSRITFNATEGTTYMIAVAGNGSAGGNISLSLSQTTVPTISSFSPSAGQPGVQVTITGFNFSGATEVRFGGVPASFSVVNANQIIAVVPEGAGFGQISVTSAFGSATSTSWFSVSRRASVPVATPDRSVIGQLSSVSGSASSPLLFNVTGSNLPAPLRVEAPPGFEVSVDGQSFSDAVEVSAPERSDRAANYSLAGWTNDANAGNGFEEWYIWTDSGTAGSAGASIANPADSGISGFGESAFSLFASPAASGAYAYATRWFSAPMAVGDTFSFRWALNWDPNTSTGYNYFGLGSQSATLLTVWQGTFPGNIFLSAASGAAIDTGIPYGTGPMTWTFQLINETTLRVSATRRDGSSEVFFTRDITVAGAPDYFYCYAYQLDPDIRRRGYFDDLRIDSASPGGGHVPPRTVHVRLAANAPAGNLSGALAISSAGQSLGSVAVSGTVTGATGSYEAWAQSHGLDPQANGARGADPDGDGHSNLREFLFGAPPAQATGSLWQHELHPSGLVLTFVGREIGVSYRLMATSDLASGTWSEEPAELAEASNQDGVPSGHKRRQITVPNPSGNRFFRLQATEAP